MTTQGMQDRVATSLAPFSFVAQGQSLHFYPEGPDRLQALVRLIDQARFRLVAMFYIFGTDRSSAIVRDALTRAALRGVKVRLIIDAFGSPADERFFTAMIEAGGQCIRFQPNFNVRYLIRNHQKLVIADDARAMLGGFNIQDSYFTAAEEGGWTDLGFTIEGSAVGQLVEWYNRLEAWCLEPKRQFRGIRRLVRNWWVPYGPVELLIGGPTTNLSPWVRRIRSDLMEAERLDMMMAYFAPSRGLWRRIKRIGKHGKVRLVFAGKSDNPATVGATRLLMGGLLRSNVEVREYDARMLHTKLIIIDDVVYFGSANFDIRSLYLNLELVLQINDAPLAERMRELISAYEADTTLITAEGHKKRATFWSRLRWGLSWFLITAVDYTVSRRLNLGL